MSEEKYSYDYAQHYQQSHMVMHSRTTHTQSHTHAIAHSYLTTATVEQISINQPYIYTYDPIYIYIKVISNKVYWRSPKSVNP